jgi:PilZ domain
MALLGNGLEHRWGERVRVNIPVSVSAATLSRVDGCMKDLSLSGAFMKAACDLRLHSLIKVHVELRSPSLRVAVLEAHVSRHLKEGVGIEWCEFAPNIVKDLLRSPSVRFPP